MRTEPFPEDALTLDAFLGGAAKILQPRQGYRAGIDPVLLAAAVPAMPGQSACELGCGAAPALCCLGRRVPDMRLVGLELQPGYADLARRNLAQNGLSGEVIVGDVAEPPTALKSRQFDHILMNPPYFEPGTRAPAVDSGREIALAGATPLADWVRCAARRLAPKGSLHVVLHIARLPELLSSVSQHLGAIEILPLIPRDGRAPALFLLRARKDGRAAFRLHPGLILHEGNRHLTDAEDYTPAVSAIVRDGAPLVFPT